MKKLLIGTLITFVALFTAYQSGKSWLKSVIPDKAHFEALKQTQVSDLPYINENIPPNRGKILAVLTSTESMGEDKATGYEHTELARAYWVFVANGFDVDIASIKGGTAPVVLDGDDMGPYDYAFLNDVSLQSKVSQTIPVAEINPLDYEAVYFVGGKGTMFDFPDNPHIQNIAKTLYQNDKVVSAVCHGPAALVNVTLDNGELLLANKKVSGFTNSEELLLIPDAETIFPFLLQDKLTEQGAEFKEGPMYLEQVAQDGNLITGQNPWSVWTMAEMIIKQLGYEPKLRDRTPEEYTIDLLATYHHYGFDAAINEMSTQPNAYQNISLVMHGMVAFMQFDIGKGIDLLRLANQLKNMVN